MITTIIGIPSDFVKTPSGSGKIICSSPLLTLVGVVVDAMESDEIEFAIRLPVNPLLIVVDDEDDAIIIDESLGSI